MHTDSGKSYRTTMTWDERKRPRVLWAEVKRGFWRLGARARRKQAGDLAQLVRGFLAEVQRGARAASKGGM